jgi:hypothetical protein
MSIHSWKNSYLNKQEAIQVLNPVGTKAFVVAAWLKSKILRVNNAIANVHG